MHVQFFPVYVLTCGAHNFEPSLSVDLRIDSFKSHNSLPTAPHGNRISKAFLEIPNFMCPLQGLGLLGSMGQIPLFLDPHLLQGVYLWY